MSYFKVIINCVIFISISFYLFSCKLSPEKKLDHALSFAGSNEGELEKVLEYYKDDSLKLEAAKYQIINMPAYFSYESKQFDLYKQNLYGITIENQCSDSKTIEIVQNKFGPLSLSSFEKVYDSHVITADYLIKNIEFSFDIWRKAPWGKYISFDEFCENILPYRIGNEPLEDWKKIYHDRYQPVLDSLLTSNDPVEACQIVFDSIANRTWVFHDKHYFPQFGALTLLDNWFGNCQDRCEMSVYIMRSLGISGGIDFILQHPDRKQNGHSWNFVKDTTGRLVEFALYDLRPGSKPKLGMEIKRGVIYRKCFGMQDSSLSGQYPDKSLPPILNNMFQKNVSSEYFEETSVTIECKKPKDEILYLSVFDNENWIPVSWAEIKDGKGTFSYMESDIAYITGYFMDGQFVPVSFPFIVRKDKMIDFLKPDTDHRQELLLKRKHSIPRWWFWFKERTLNGKFQGANRSDFKDAVTLYTITHEATMDHYWVDIPEERQFNYLRYLSGNEGYCNMAEVRFYSETDTLLSGEVIGTEGSFQNDPSRTRKAVFDNDPLTFYDANEANGAWAGIRLNTPKQIKKIYYQFRNDDNNICIGDTYELMYWGNSNKWESAGKVVADKEELTYSGIPSGTLYLLHNHTRGNEERIFTYENGKQVWW